MKDVHTEHCCAIHGCKYSDKDCTVILKAENKEYVQSHPCETCYINGLDTLSKVLKYMHPTMNTFANHIVMYAKNWYGSSYNGQKGSQYILDDLKALLSRWSWVAEKDISNIDIQHFLIRTFNECVTNEHVKNEKLAEMLGWKYGRNDGIMSDREPEVVIIGALSCVEGHYIYLPDIFEDVCFDRDRGVDCKDCHRSKVEKGKWNYCKAQNCKKAEKVA